MPELDAEEREILEAYLAGDLRRLTLTAEEIADYREAARALSRKDQRVNIRMSARDLEDLKIKALEEGMPYQTLMASVLHRYATGQFEGDAPKAGRGGRQVSGPWAAEAVAEPETVYDPAEPDCEPED